MSASAPIRPCEDTAIITKRYFAELWLVESFGDGMLQPFDLILDHQLAALQLDNLHIVCGEMHERFVQFILKALVFTF
jgi:hypothetical protein